MTLLWKSTWGKIMKYRDLINFEPIESVIELTDANDKDKALELIDNFVISDRMAKTINDVIVTQLQYTSPEDNKGLLIIGNYGSGKSHLMSVISTIAERSGTVEHISNPAVKDRLKDIEGQFKVIRCEIGSTTMGLREIILGNLENGLSEMGIEVHFPKSSEVSNNKDSLLDMMEKFNEVYPEKGLLLVVDELLDYLRGRKDQELALDLGFLREIGEIAYDTRFRFMAGLQEMLFNNPRFNFVADSLRRIQERFEQVTIVKEDISYVVSERLLKKNVEQKSLIRNHLNKFTLYYDRLNEDMDTFVEMYPIHPRYLEVFEQVRGIEKRQALKTITNEIKKVLDEEVPTDMPGIISYDSYWNVIKNNSVNNTNPDIREVIKKSNVLFDKVKSSYPRLNTKEMALKIINALSVNRLTTDNIDDHIGLTATSLRDDLFLMNPMIGSLFEGDELNALKTNIETVLSTIMQTVSYQYIALNKDNGQYYLDLKQDIDVDSIIENKIESLDDSALDRYYYQILQNATTLDDNTYVSGYKIWKYELPWDSHGVMRKGYIFFGAPNERSTAQPERDFYIYMLHPFDKTAFKDEQRDDEIFFELNLEDAEFKSNLQHYAAASLLYDDASVNQKGLYRSKREKYGQILNKWLIENFVTIFRVTYKGRTEENLLVPGTESLKEMINYIASERLDKWFSSKYPDYPVFRMLGAYISNSNMDTYVDGALQRMNGRKNVQGDKILEGLVLLDDRNEVTSKSVNHSGYARQVLDVLGQKKRNQVVNNDELFDIHRVRGVEDIRITKNSKLEPELLVVVLAALLKTGRIEISIDGKAYNSLDYSEFIKQPLSKLVKFDYIKKPSELPMAEVNAILDMFEEPAANNNEDSLERAIRIVNTKLDGQINQAIDLKQNLKSDFMIGGKNIVPNNQKIIDQLSSYQEFCNQLKRFDSIAKLKNLPFKLEDIDQQDLIKKEMQQLLHRKPQIDDLNRLVEYLMMSKNYLSMGNDWDDRVKTCTDQLVANISNKKDSFNERQALLSAKKQYIDQYFDIHEKKKLNVDDDRQLKNIESSNKVKILDMLAKNITILPANQLANWKQKMNLASQNFCYQLSKEDLQKTPYCPYCHSPLENNDKEGNYKEMVRNAADQLSKIYDNWVQIIISGLLKQEGVSLLGAEDRQIIEKFTQNEELPNNLQHFIKIVKGLFSGLEKIDFNFNDLKIELQQHSPMSVDELEGRIKEYISKLINDKNKETLRILIK